MLGNPALGVIAALICLAVTIFAVWTAIRDRNGS